MRIDTICAFICIAAHSICFTQGQDTNSPPQVEMLIILEPRPIQNVPGRSTLRLQCSASGNPIPEYSWKKDGVLLVDIDNKIIITESVLEIKNVEKAKDDGIYQCLATNVLGTVFMEINIVNFIMGRFQYPFRRADTSADVKVHIGKEVVIQCPPHGETFPEIIQWGDLPDGKLPILWYPSRRRFFSDTGELVFPEVSEDDIEEINNLQGVSCLLYNDKVYEQSRKVYLRSLGTQLSAQPPRFKVTLKSSFTEVKGQRLVLRCGAIGSPIPEIMWFKDNVQIKRIAPNKYNFDRFRIEGGGVELTVDLVHESDRGLYECVATNSGGREFKRGTLSVHFPPEWLTMINDASVPISGTHQLNCSAFSEPASSYEWYKNGTRITDTFNPRLKPNANVLTLVGVEEEDSGMYVCLARNPHGSITTTSQIKVSTMAPMFDPPIPDPIYLFRNRVNYIPCRPIGGPLPTKTWFKDNSQVIADDRHTLGTDGSLTVTNPVDADAGFYKCVAENRLGKAESTGLGKVIDPTVITVAPANESINVGFHVQLFCDASHDPNLELKIDWMKDGQLMTYFDDRIFLDFRVSGPSRVLTFKLTEFNDRGAYSCRAYTSLDGLVSEDTGIGFLTVRSRPDPPTGVDTASGDSCNDFATKIIWRVSSPNGDNIEQLIIEYSSSYTDDNNKWYILNPKLQPGTLEEFETTQLPGDSDLKFRVFSTNKIGISDASLPSPLGKCKTPLHAPWRNPSTWGHPTTAGKLALQWERFTKIHQGAPGFSYELRYRRVVTPPADFTIVPITNFNQTSYEVPDPGTFQPYEFAVVAINSEGRGPEPTYVKTFSGQPAPTIQVATFFARTKGPNAIILEWVPVAPLTGSIGGYRVYYWNWTGDARPKRVRRDEPVSDAFVKEFPGNEFDQNFATGNVGNLTSLSTYFMIIKPYNSGGEGPGSLVITVSTEGTISNTPHNVRVRSYGHVLFIQWEPPLRSSGPVFDYHIHIENGSVLHDTNLPPLMKLRFEYWERFAYITGLLPTHSYVIKIAARNRYGMGEFFLWKVATSFPDKPGKPKRPTLVPIDSYGINCTFNLADGGGFPSSFTVYYRPKGDLLSKVGVVTQEFPLYQWKLVSGLSANPFEFWVVARNSLGDSVPSDVSEATPKPYAPAREEFVAAIAWYRSNWFIAICVAVAFLLLVLIVVLILIQRNGGKYQVARREQARAGWNAKPSQDDYNNEEPYADDYATRPLKNDFPDNRPPPRYPSQTSVEKRDPSDENDSLDDYGEDTKFDEDGSFMGQYGEEKRRSVDLDEKKEDPDMSTFV